MSIDSNVRQVLVGVGVTFVTNVYGDLVKLTVLCFIYKGRNLCIIEVTDLVKKSPISDVHLLIFKVYISTTKGEEIVKIYLHIDMSIRVQNSSMTLLPFVCMPFRTVKLFKPICLFLKWTKTTSKFKRDVTVH